MSDLNEHVSVKGEGLPIVLLHCSLSSKAQWQSLCHTLSGFYKTIAIDLLGYGANSPAKPRSDFTLDDEIAHVYSSLDSILSKKDAFHLVGHSYGGAVALKLAQQNSQNVLSLTLYEPVSFHLLAKNHEELRRVKGIYSLCLQLLRDKKPHLAAEVFIDFWSGRGSFRRLSDSIRRDYSRRMTKVLMDFLAIIKDPITSADLNRLPFLTHLIHGSNTPEAARAITYTLSQSLVYKTQHILDAGHLGPITHAAKFNQLLYKIFAIDIELNQAPSGTGFAIPNSR